MIIKETSETSSGLA